MDYSNHVPPPPYTAHYITYLSHSIYHTFNLPILTRTLQKTHLLNLTIRPPTPFLTFTTFVITIIFFVAISTHRIVHVLLYFASFIKFALFVYFFYSAIPMYTSLLCDRRHMVFPFVISLPGMYYYVICYAP